MGSVINKAYGMNVDPSEYPRDQLTLLQFPRSEWTPSLSPFPLKLETYLRMAKIPYQNVFGKKMSSKGKTPCIVHDGKEIGDSQLCIEYLNKVNGVDLNAHLTDEEKAIAWAYQIMIEDHLYWALVLSRWVYGPQEGGEVKAMMERQLKGVPSFVVSHFRSKFSEQASAQGLGRHSKEDVMILAQRDIRSLSTFLGEKPFLMGDEPCLHDCGIFGLMAQLYWMLPGPLEQLVKGDCKNIGAYCERMKERFWPDWDHCITHGGTKEATK